MRRKLSLLIALIGVFGLIGLTPAAEADHYTGAPGKVRNDISHDAQPEPPDAPSVTGACAVQGEVSINQGVDSTPRHNHYRFADTAITCRGLDPNYDRTFDVDAAGGTDGPGAVSMGTTHGEDDLRGWSHKSCYVGVDDPGCTDTNDKLDPVDDLYDGTNRNGDGTDCWNCGEIRVQSIDPVTDQPDGQKSSGFGTTSDNFVMFDRVGVNVIAWGALTDAQGNAGAQKDPNEVVCFLAELEFTPTNPPEGGEVKPVDRAILTGAADIWITQNKGDCMGTPGGKKGGS